MDNEKQVVKYSVVEADIAKMRDIYMDLVITDLTDKEQFKQVKEARLVVKGKRYAVENERKSLKKEALEWGRKVDGEAKKIFALIEPIETHLQNEEQKVIDEENRLKAEEEERQRKIIQKRVEDLLAVECVMPHIEVSTMTDEEFNNLLTGKTLEFEEAQKLKTIKEAEQKAEAERLAQQKAEQDAKEAELKRQAEELAAKEKAIQDEKDRIAKEEAEKKAAEEAKIKAEQLKRLLRQEAKEKAEREAKETEEKRIAAEKEAKRQEALKPDKEKIAEWLNQGEWNWLDKYPADVSEEAAQFIGVVRDEIAAQILDYRKQLEVF